MSSGPYERRPFRPERRRRSRRLVVARRWTIRLLLAAAFFGGGVALGQALDDNPEPGQVQTLIRTLRPLPLAPAPRTVTVTVAP